MSERKGSIEMGGRERGDKLPGGTGAQNTSKRSQQVDTGTEEESALAFYGVCHMFCTRKRLTSIYVTFRNEMLQQYEVRKARPNGSFDIFGCEVIY